MADISETLRAEAKILRDMQRHHARSGRVSSALGCSAFASQLEALAHYFDEPTRDRDERIEAMNLRMMV